MRFFVFLLFFITALDVFTPSTWAYTLSNASNGSTIRWRYGQKLYLAGNPTGQTHHSSSFFFESVVNSLQQWKWASQGQFDFDYWQGTDPAHYSTGFKQDGLNSLFFASNSADTSDPNVIGYTQVWYNDRTGDVLETDILLNDRDYAFTSTISDTSSRTYLGYRPSVYLRNILTHELGHAIGLSHSANINSSMLYVEFREQAKLGCDDWAAARHLYSPGGGTGTLSGSVVSPWGDPLAGAAVTAISHSRGIPIATVMTDQAGGYAFGALEPGAYSISIQAYQGSASSVPARFQAKATNYCGASSFPTQFVKNADGHSLTQYSVGAGGSTSAGTFRVTCASISDSLNLYTNQAAPEMLVDRISSGSTKTYLFQVNGPFTLTSIGYLLLSPVNVQLAVYDLNGNAVSIQTKSPLYESPSQFSIPDSQISGTAYGTIVVQVTTQHTDIDAFPAPAIWPTSESFFVLNLNTTPGAPSSALPENGRCAPSTSFAAYQSPPGHPIRFSTTKSARDVVGFCGTAEADPTRPQQSAHSVPAGSIVGWFFPFMVALVAQLSFRKRQAKLKV